LPRERLATGYALDSLWGETMGLPDRDSKARPLRLVAELLERERVRYARIGGVAVQLHTREPRTTLDIDFDVLVYADVPAEALLAAASSTPADTTTATTGARRARVHGSSGRRSSSLPRVVASTC